MKWNTYLKNGEYNSLTAYYSVSPRYIIKKFHELLGRRRDVFSGEMNLGGLVLFLFGLAYLISYSVFFSHVLKMEFNRF